MLIIKGARGVSRDLLELVSVKEVKLYHVLLIICEKVLEDVRARALARIQVLLMIPP